MSPLTFALAPALPLQKAGPYVAAAYIVFVAIILIYVTIMGIRLTRSQRELVELRRELQERERQSEIDPTVRGNSIGSSADAELPASR